MAIIAVDTARHLQAEFRLQLPSSVKDNLARRTTGYIECHGDSTRIRGCSFGQLYLLLLSSPCNLAMANIAVDTVRHLQAEFFGSQSHPPPWIYSTQHMLRRVMIPSRFPERGAPSIPSATCITFEFDMDSLHHDGVCNHNSHGQVSIKGQCDKLE
jgi:hypothetical protein